MFTARLYVDALCTQPAHKFALLYERFTAPNLPR